MTFLFNIIDPGPGARAAAPAPSHTAHWPPSSTSRRSAFDTPSAPAPGGRPSRRPIPVSVLIVIDHLGFANGVVHGPGQLLLEQLPRLDRSLVRPTLCVLRERHALGEQFADRGFPPIFLGRAKWDPRAVGDLVRLMRAEHAEVAHLLGEKAMTLGRIAARAVGCRAIIHLHDTKRSGRIVRFAARRLAPWTEAALGCADAVTDIAVRDWKIPRARARTLLNGHSIERFSNPSPDAHARVRAELRIAPDAPLIAVVGRMAPEKGHELLIRAMPSIVAGCPGAALAVVGDGVTRAECERLARSLALEKSVRFAGQRQDIPDVLAAADVVALPSRYGEGLPGVAIEAIAAGRPVVAFPVGGTTDIVLHERTGLVVPQDDAAAMADALLRVLTDADLRARLQCGCRTHSETFRLEENVRQTEDLYLHAAAGTAEAWVRGVPAPRP